MFINLYIVDYAHDGRIDGAVLALEGHSRGTALHDEHDFVDAGSYGIDGDEMALLILALDVDHSRYKQLAPVKTVIFSRSDDSSDYSSENHRGQLSVSLFDRTDD